MDNDFFYKINRDYIELKDILDDNEKVADFFHIDDNHINSALSLLRSSKENGFLETRESLLKNIYSILEDGLYKTLAIEKLDTIQFQSIIILLITLVLRKFYYGSIKVKNENTENGSTIEDIKKIDIKSIIANLSYFIKAYNGIQNNKSYKEIVIKIKNYNTEVAKVNELIKNLTGDKKKQFLENTKKTLLNFHDGIKKSYSQLLDYIYENFSDSNKNTQEKIYNKIKYNTFYPIINEEISNFSRLYSSINFIITEKSSFLKVIEKIYSKFDDFVKILHKEEQLLFTLLIKNKIDSSKIENLINEITDIIISALENYLPHKKEL